MKITPFRIQLFLFFKLPSAWFCGVRLKYLKNEECATTIKHRWINQNPFGSMYFAAQAMAAELSTGALLLSAIKAQDEKISMLVAQNKTIFSKKATGRIVFTCTDGKRIAPALKQTLKTGEGQTFWLQSVGSDQKGEVVSVFDFEWTIRAKKD